MISVYEEAVSAGVRRHVDKHPDVMSFAKLLCEILCNPWILSIEPDEVKKDLEQLVQKSEVVKKYVDKVIAHLDKKKPLNYGSVDTSLRNA